MEKEAMPGHGFVSCLGRVFASDDERRSFFREELRGMLHTLRGLPGFPAGSDEDILALSDPPYYTACPNPWIKDFIAQWESEKALLQAAGQRDGVADVAEPFALPVREQKNSAVYNAHAYHTKVPPEVVMNYYLHYTRPGDIVYDGFAGTGMSGIAANFCASPTDAQRESFDRKWQTHFGALPAWGVRRCVLGDLSPITSFIAYNYSTPVAREDFLAAAGSIYSRLSDELGALYEFAPSDSVAGTTNYVVWSEVQVCQHCHGEFVYWDVAVDMAHDRQLDSYECPHCGAEIKKSKSQKAFTTVYDELLNASVEMCVFVPVYINYTTADGKRVERNLTTDEREAIIARQPAGLLKGMRLASLREGDKTSDPFRLGIRYLHQFYSKRNFYILARFRELIEEYDCDERLKKYLLIWFSSCQSRLHMMNRYAPRHHRHVGPLANTFYVSATPTEISPFYFIKSKIKDNALLLEGGRNVVNQVASATCSGLPDNSVDYIFTDPPFGSNIMYSELNFIWEAWLGLSTDNREEAVANKTQRKSIADYQAIMTRCFCEYFRVLKPGRWMTVEFSNTSAAVWNTIQHSLREAGFVIASVSDLDKGRAGLHGIVGVTAVNQDLAITCYKPTDELVARFRDSDRVQQNVWDFVDELLRHLPVHLRRDDSTAAIAERSAKILFDRMVAYFVQHGYQVPLDAREFQKGLKVRFVERDDMFFTDDQAVEYDSKRAATASFETASVFVGSEAEGIQWLKSQLDEPKTYQQLQPEWMHALVATRRGDNLPELKTLLEENFLQQADGRWFRPDPEKEADLEKMRNRRLAHEFKVYVGLAGRKRGKIKEARLEALRYGFRECYRNNEFQMIVDVAERLPEALLMEDEQLLQYYDIAMNRI